MNILVIDLGTKLVKCSLFHADVSIDKKMGMKSINEFSLIYFNMFENGSDKLLLLELNRVYIELGSLVDLTIFIPNKIGIDITCRHEENELSRDKLEKYISDSVTSKGSKKIENIFTVELQNYDINNNHTDIIIGKMAMPDYERVKKLIKDLKLINVSTFTGTSALKYLVPQTGEFIVYDLGYTNQELIYIKDGIIKTIERRDCDLKSIDKELLKTYDDKDLYVMKHSKSLIDIKKDNKSIQLVLNNINAKLNDFVKLNGINSSGEVCIIGGFANTQFENDFFDLNLCTPFIGKKFKNSEEIEEPLMNYIYSSVCTLLYYFDENCVDFLDNRKDLAIVSTKINSFLDKSKFKLTMIASILLLNMAISIPLSRTLESEYAQFQNVDVSQVGTSKSRYEDACKKIDTQISSADLMKHSFKLNALVKNISSIKPSSINVSDIQYTNENLIINLVTSDLKENSYFIKNLSNIFERVEIKSPEVIVNGVEPVFKIKVLCSGYKG